MITVEITWRLGIFLTMLVIMLAWEHFQPCRAAQVPVAMRRTHNILLMLIGNVVVRLTVPLLAVGVASIAESRGWGLFNSVAAPQFVTIAAAILALELAVYWQHRVLHMLPWLWRLHRVHHSDLDFDTTTGVRFHALEMLVSMAFKMLVVLMLGASVMAVVVFEVLLNASSLFNHGNVSLPQGLDRRLRWVLVTPDMHRVHHSAQPEETNSNFGFLLSWWDRFFGTYRGQPAGGNTGMTIGLTEFREQRAVNVLALLWQPLWGEGQPPSSAASN